MSDHSPPPAKRGKITIGESSQKSKEEAVKKYPKQQEDIEQLEQKNNCGESSRRENILVMRLANKEQEVQEYAAQIFQIKKVHEDAALLSLRQANLDPGVNLLFGKMCEELKQTKDKLEQAQSELSAWKFTPDSQNGKKLISRCRTLIAENQELGRQLSQGKSAQLEAELALQKKYSEQLKASQDELNEFVIQLDEEVEGMQSVIQSLQQQLAATKQESENHKKIISQYESEMGSAKDAEPSTSPRKSQKIAKGYRGNIQPVSRNRTGSSDSENEYNAQNGELELNANDKSAEGFDSSTSGDEDPKPTYRETDANDESDSWSKEGGDDTWDDRTNTRYSDHSSEEAVEVEVENQELDYDTPLEDDDHITANITAVSNQVGCDQAAYDNFSKKCTNNVKKNPKNNSKPRNACLETNSGNAHENETPNFSINASSKSRSHAPPLPSDTTKKTEQNVKGVRKSTRERVSQTAVVLA